MNDINQQGCIGIIGAMEVEVEAVLENLTDKKVTQISSIRFTSGLLEGVPCIVAKSGAGKVNAAVCAQTMAIVYKPSLIINIGVAGGIGKGIDIGDFVIARACVQHDFDTSRLGDEIGFVAGIMTKEIPCDAKTAGILLSSAQKMGETAHIGVIATGDVFLADPIQHRLIETRFGAKAVEMEGGSIAHVCYMNKIRCAVLRAISDCADNESPSDFSKFVEKTAVHTQALLKKAIPLL